MFALQIPRARRGHAALKVKAPTTPYMLLNCPHFPGGMVWLHWMSNAVRMITMVVMMMVMIAAETTTKTTKTITTTTSATMTKTAAVAKLMQH